MQDIDMLVGGYVIVFVYVLVMLGRWDCVEQKVYLSMGGILGVMMGIVVSVTIVIIIIFSQLTLYPGQLRPVLRPGLLLLRGPRRHALPAARGGD